MHAVIDVETTGLPIRMKGNQYFAPSELDKYERSRVVQVTAKVGDEVVNEYIYPTFDFVIENHHIHGITTEKAKSQGRSFEDVGQLLMEMFHRRGVETVVGHNIEFDLHVLRSEALRHGMTSLNIFLRDAKKRDTMTMGRIRMGQRKNPKLDELYLALTGSERVEENKHNSLYDVEDTDRCYNIMTGNIS